MHPHGALARSAGVCKDLFGKTAIPRLAVRQVPAHRLARRCRVARPDRAIDRAVLLLDHFEIGALAFGAMGSDADGLPRDEEVVREIWPFYAVMFFVLMLVTYIPSISLWLPRL